MQSHLSFTVPCSNRLNCYPSTEKLFLQMATALGPIGEVHFKFKVGKIEFDDIFVILNSLQ